MPNPNRTETAAAHDRPAHAVLACVEQRIRRHGPVALFAASVVFYFAVQFALIVPPILLRTAPVEPDDAYSYIVKGAELESGLLQDCPAFNDLRDQLAFRGAEGEAGFERYRQYHRLFSFYVPLHSAMLAALHAVGLTWEGAYHVLLVVGIVVIGAGIASWLLALLGAAPAGFAMLLMAVTMFSDQGLHYIVPSNVTLGVALLTWATIVRRRGPSVPGLLLGIAVMLFMHPVGRLYSILALLAFWVLADRTRLARRWLTPLAGLLLIALVSALPLIVSRPELRVVRDPVPENWSRLHGAVINLVESAKRAAAWVHLDRDTFAHAGVVLTDLAFLVLVGALTLERDRRRKGLVLAVLLMPLLLSDLVFPHPRYPSAIFARVWIPLAILMIGCIGQAAAWSIGSLYQRVRSGDWTVDSQEYPFLGSGVAHLILGILVLISLGRFSIPYTLNNLERIRREQVRMLTRDPMVLDRQQPANLLRHAQRGDRVLYTNEATLYYFLTYGGFDLGAIYLPAIAGTPDEARWLSQGARIDFLATTNPARTFPLWNGSGLTLPVGERLAILSAEPRPLSSYTVGLVNRGGAAVLDIEVPAEGGNRAVALRVPAGFRGYMALPQGEAPSSERFSLALRRGGPLALEGLRTSTNTDLRWPWNEHISFAYAPAANPGTPHAVAFTTDSLAPPLNRSVRVLMDSGATVLAAVGD